MCVCVCVCVCASAFRRYQLHLFSQYGVLWTHLCLWNVLHFPNTKQNTESERTQPYHTHMESVVNEALTPFPFLTIIRELCVLENYTHTHTNTSSSNSDDFGTFFSFSFQKSFLQVALDLFSNFQKIHQKKQKDMALEFTMQKLACIIASHCLEHLHRCSICHSG
jgi:hypothetical protein